MSDDAVLTSGKPKKRRAREVSPEPLLSTSEGKRDDARSLREPDSASQPSLFTPADARTFYVRDRADRKLPRGRNFMSLSAGYTHDLAGLSDRAFRAWHLILDRLAQRGSTTGLLPSDREELKRWCSVRQENTLTSVLDELLAARHLVRLPWPLRFVVDRHPRGRLGSGGHEVGARLDSPEVEVVTECGLVGQLVARNWAKFQGYASQSNGGSSHLLSSPILSPTPTVTKTQAGSPGEQETAAAPLPRPREDLTLAAEPQHDPDPPVTLPPDARAPSGFPSWPRSWYEARAGELAEAMAYGRHDRIPLRGGPGKPEIASVSTPGIVVGWLSNQWDAIHESATRRAKRGATPALKQTASAWWRRLCDDLAGGTPAERTWGDLRGACAWLRGNIEGAAVEKGRRDFDELLARAKAKRGG